MRPVAKHEMLSGGILFGEKMMVQIGGEKLGVSYVVPVYNKAPWLPDVLGAIWAQVGDFEREYVFVDDGSDDASMQIVREITADWPNVILIEQQNHGSAHATNRGIESASQPFIKFVDADDLLAAHATDTLLTALASSDACLAYGNVVHYREPDEIDLDAYTPSPTVVRIDDPLPQALRNSMFGTDQFMARAECVKAVGGCDERIVHSQEYSLTLRLARKWPFLKVDAPIGFIPAHVPGSLGANQGKQLQRVTRAVANFVRDFPDLPQSAKQFACQRTASRAWNFRRRTRDERMLSRWFWINLRARFPIHSGHGEFIDECATAFD